jgi:hypothetical protein
LREVNQVTTNTTLPSWQTLYEALGGQATVPNRNYGQQDLNGLLQKAITQLPLQHIPHALPIHNDFKDLYQLTRKLPKVTTLDHLSQPMTTKQNSTSKKSIATITELELTSQPLTFVSYEPKKELDLKPVPKHIPRMRWRRELISLPSFKSLSKVCQELYLLTLIVKQEPTSQFDRDMHRTT